jgi:hypothetical protein
VHEAIEEASRGWVDGEWLWANRRLDLAAVAGVGVVDVLPHRVGLLNDAMDELGERRLIRLVRALRLWNSAVRTWPPLRTCGPRPALGLELGRVMQVWFVHWHGGAVDTELSSRQAIELLLATAEAKLERRRRRPRLLRRPAPSERLLRLAGTIVSHAPPRSLGPSAISTGAA